MVYADDNGEGLHISRINLDKGEADIDGKADSLYIQSVVR